VPLKAQREILGHAADEMSLLYSEASMELRRAVIMQLDAALYAPSDASGRKMQQELQQARPN
jgi:hypothetical protein